MQADASRQFNLAIYYPLLVSNRIRIMDSTSVHKPFLHRNMPLPLEKLSPDSFEDFTYQSLSKLASEKGFKLESGRQPSGDGGFDCVAREVSNNNLICIQCKRYTDTLNSNTVAEEILKVSLNGVLEGGIPTKHYIITAGTVSKKLRTQLRQKGYVDIKSLCKKLIDGNEYLVEIIKKVKAQCLEPYDEVCSYIDNLTDLVVWSAVDFQNELVCIWSRLSDILEEHFSLAVVFKEHPRPDFDVAKYLKSKKVNNEKLIPLSLRQASLPNKLSVESQINSLDNYFWSFEELLTSLKEKKNVLISSVGGSGKSSTLSLIEMALHDSFSDDLCLPVRINLRSYSRNSLKEKIEQELDINFGSWKSLPFRFIFIFDALDEMLQHDTQAFVDDLSSQIDGYNFVLTVRNTGLNIHTTIPILHHCVSVQPLSYRNAFQIAEKELDGDRFKLFTDSYREKLSQTGINFLTLPFAFSLTIDYFKKNMVIPDNIEEIFDWWMNSKIKNDGGKVKELNSVLNTLPAGIVSDAFSFVLYCSRVEDGCNSISELNYHNLLMRCYDKLDTAIPYLKRALGMNEFIAMISHFEILVLGDDGLYSTPHPILADYLISKLFARNWRDNSSKWLVNSFQEVWFYASNYINQDDKNDYLQTLLSFDLNLAARVAKKFGEGYSDLAEKTLLEAEQSNKVLERSEAIFALGVLGTEKCLERLRSKDNTLDQHHISQRERALAYSGDLTMLEAIFLDNESLAEIPVNVSGGNYQTWFSSPPSVITNIARKRLNEWVHNPNLRICFCLRTIRIFGDGSDIDILTKVVESSKNSDELNHACLAINAIRPEVLILQLSRLIEEHHRFSFQMKNILLSLGKKSDISEEVNYFLQQFEKDESELADSNVMHKLMELARFIERFGLDELNKKKFVEAYSRLHFTYDFYVYRLVWSIAISCNSDFFLPIAESAFKRGDHAEIHHAMLYLSSIDKLILSEELSNNIESFFVDLGDGLDGIKLSYFKYYKKYNNSRRVKELLDELLEKSLLDLEPEDISYSQYRASGFSNFILIELLNSEEIEYIDDSVLLKLLLICTDSIPDLDRAKNNVLKRVSKVKINEFVERIKDRTVLCLVTNGLLKNDLSVLPLEVFKVFLPQFLSHHMFYPTIEKVCDENWSDDLASVFLACFADREWGNVDAQMFEKYITFFLGKLTEKQMRDFESQRTKPIHYNVRRIYQIWLEHIIGE